MLITIRGTFLDPILSLLNYGVRKVAEALIIMALEEPAVMFEVIFTCPLELFFTYMSAKRE